MTEQEWLACEDPQPMMDLLRDKVNERKLRLFALSCCRRIWNLIADTRLQNVVNVVDRYAEGQASEEERLAAWRMAQVIVDEEMNIVSDWNTDGWRADAARAVAETAYAENGDRWGFKKGWHNAAEFAAVATARPRTASYSKELRCQADLLRHIFGNPFRPYPAPPSWPTAIVALAEALYAGEPCAFALHDALLEAGHPALAEHFQAEPCHPKGCWALDLILGKS